MSQAKKERKLGKVVWLLVIVAFPLGLIGFWNVREDSGKVFEDQLESSLRKSNQDDLRFAHKDRDLSSRVNRLISKSGFPTHKEILEILQRDGAEHAWNAVEDVSDEHYRRGLQASIVKAMGQAGLLDEGFALISNKLEPGDLRENLVYELIRNASNPIPGLLELGRNLKESVDKKGLLRGVEFLVMRQGVESFQSDTFDRLDYDERIVIGEGLAIYFGQNRGEAGPVVNSLKALTAKEPKALKVLEGFVKSVPLEKLKSLMGWFSENSNQGRDSELAGLVMRRVAAVSPEWSIKFALGSNGVVDLRFVADAAHRLSKFDAKRASALFDRVEAEQLELRAAMAEGIGIAEGTRGNFANARKFAAEITDPDTIKRVEGHLWRLELEVVRKEVAEDPVTFVEGFMNGESRHEEYWMKEGFKTWFSGKPDDANAWYRENERTLTPSQSQHVARAYAEVALSEGNADLARQWADRVVDPEFKEKLVDQIEAASQKNSE